MSDFFSSTEETLLEQTTNLLGRDIEYTNIGNGTTTIKGIYDNLYIEVEGVVTLKPTVRINPSDLPFSIRKGDTLVVASTDYTVLESRKEVGGGALLILQKV